MFTKKAQVLFSTFILCASPFSTSLLSQEIGFDCSFSDHLTTQDSILMAPGAPAFQDTTLHVAVFFVEFSDADSNTSARGSVGWNDENPATAVSIEKKFRSYHFWDMFFSTGTYIDIDPGDPRIHPDVDSHPSLDLATYGSLRDYYLENSNNNLEILPAVTHPALTDTLFRIGIINHIDSTDSSIVWGRLPNTFAYYNNGKAGLDILNDAVVLACSLYDNGLLDVRIDSTNIIDRAIICVAGSATGGLAAGFNARYSVLREKARPGVDFTEYLGGPGGFAHEFGHQIGHDDYMTGVMIQNRKESGILA